MTVIMCKIMVKRNKIQPQYIAYRLDLVVVLASTMFQKQAAIDSLQLKRDHLLLKFTKLKHLLNG